MGSPVHTFPPGMLLIDLASLPINIVHFRQLHPGQLEGHLFHPFKVFVGRMHRFRYAHTCLSTGSHVHTCCLLQSRVHTWPIRRSLAHPHALHFVLHLHFTCSLRHVQTDFKEVRHSLPQMCKYPQPFPATRCCQTLWHNVMGAVGAMGVLGMAGLAAVAATELVASG